jgi:hypothetical protein
MSLGLDIVTVMRLWRALGKMFLVTRKTSFGRKLGIMIGVVSLSRMMAINVECGITRRDFRINGILIL